MPEVTAPPAPPSPPPFQSSIRDQLIRDAQSGADLLSKAETFDPELAQALNPSAAVKTPVGAVLAAALTLVVTHYGLGWDANMVGSMTALAIIAGHYIQALIQKPAPLITKGTSA